MEKIAVSVIAGLVLWMISSFREDMHRMSVSVISLNERIAVIIERMSYHDRQISDHERRIKDFEKRHLGTDRGRLGD